MHITLVAYGLLISFAHPSRITYFMRFFLLIVILFSCLASNSQESSLNVNPLTNPSIIWDQEVRGDGSIHKEIRPYDYQLYPRNQYDRGYVRFQGRLNGGSKFSLLVSKITFDGDSSLFAFYSIVPISGKFNISNTLEAGLFEYSFHYSFDDNYWIPLARKVVCGDAYLVSGQSNAITVELDSNEVNSLMTDFGPETDYGRYSRTFGDIWKCHGPWRQSKVTGAGKPISFTVGAWALALQYKISKEYGMPTCFINGAIPGSSISDHLPPLSGPDFYHDSMVNKSHFFRHLNTRTYEAGLENYIRGIFWWQGDGGQDGQTAGEYHNTFEKMYGYWKSYFPDFRQLFLIQVHSITGVDGEHVSFTSEDQRKMPEWHERCSVMASNGIGLHRYDTAYALLHFRSEAYVELARRLLPQVANVNYNYSGENTEAPEIAYAYRNKNTITLYFQEELSKELSDSVLNIVNLIRFDVPEVQIADPRIEGKSFIFSISDTNIQTVSYLGAIPGNDPDLKCYLRNNEGIAALTFHEVQVYTTPYSSPEASAQNNIKVCPNPADEIFRFQFEGTESVEYELFTTNLYLLFKGVTHSGDQIDCRNVPSGTYFYRISSVNDKRKYYCGKLLIVHSP